MLRNRGPWTAQEGSFSIFWEWARVSDRKTTLMTPCKDYVARTRAQTWYACPKTTDIAVARVISKSESAVSARFGFGSFRIGGLCVYGTGSSRSADWHSSSARTVLLIRDPFPLVALHFLGPDHGNTTVWVGGIGSLRRVGMELAMLGTIRRT